MFLDRWEKQLFFGRADNKREYSQENFMTSKIMPVSRLDFEVEYGPADARHTDTLTTDPIFIAATDRDAESKNPVYLAHKMGKQVGYWSGWAASYSQQMAASYRAFTEQYRRNPASDVFAGDPVTAIYRRETPLGRVAERIFLPKEYRRDHLSENELNHLNAGAHGVLTRAARFLQVADGFRLMGDGAAIASCYWGEGECKTREITVAGLDTVSTMTWFGVHTLRNHSAKIVEQAGLSEDAIRATELKNLGYKAFQRTTRVLIAANALEVVVGMSKMGVEVRNYFVDPSEMKPSAFVDGAIDTGLGGAWFAYSYFLLKQAAIAKAEGDIARATTIMSFWGKPPPTKLLASMRIIGISGAGIGAVSNGLIIYEGIDGVDRTGRKLSQEEQTRRVVSGSIGFASSLLFAAAAFFVTPAAQPIAAILVTAAGVLIVAQTIYDEHDAIAAFFDDRENTSTRLPPLSQSKFASTFDGIPALFNISQGYKFPNFFPFCP